MFAFELGYAYLSGDRALESKIPPGIDPSGVPAPRWGGGCGCTANASFSSPAVAEVTVFRERLRRPGRPKPKAREQVLSFRSFMSYLHNVAKRSGPRRGGWGGPRELLLQDPEAKAPTGRCRCDSMHWHYADSSTDHRPVSCLNCGAHWWDLEGQEVQGPPFARVRLYRDGRVNREQNDPVPLTRERFPKNVSRFTYWRVPAINPFAGTLHDEPGLPELPPDSDPFAADKAAHQDAEQRFGQRHRAGDQNAIFEYAKEDAWAFRSRWVVEQMEAWRANGEVGKLRTLMTRYAGAKGKTPREQLCEIISRDQRIFRDVLAQYDPEGQADPPMSREAVFAEVAEQHGVREDTVKLVYDHYRPYYDDEVPTRWSRSAFFDELEKMLERLCGSR